MAQKPLKDRAPDATGEAPLVAARVPESLHQALLAAAARRGVTPSVLLRQSIERLVSDELDELAREISDSG